MHDIPETNEDFNQNGIRFLEIDVQTALIMADIALGAKDDSEKMVRNTRTARNAYDTILRLRERLCLTPEQKLDLHSKLQKLRLALQQLGETF